jgi:membrane-bound lytic murein transglycosylase B
MFKISTKTMITTALTGLIIAATTSAMAETEWQMHHQRRSEVNHRLNNQDRRIHNEVKEGEISKQQLHKDDRQIRQEERAMASQNGGHITKQEDKTLNQQENHVSQEIGK